MDCVQAWSLIKKKKDGKKRGWTITPIKLSKETN
jgi:predicted helicase